jgi:hypothetical protein
MEDKKHKEYRVTFKRNAKGIKEKGKDGNYVIASKTLTDRETVSISDRDRLVNNSLTNSTGLYYEEVKPKKVVKKEVKEEPKKDK